MYKLTAKEARAIALATYKDISAYVASQHNENTHSPQEGRKPRKTVTDMDTTKVNWHQLSFEQALELENARHKKDSQEQTEVVEGGEEDAAEDE